MSKFISIIFLSICVQCSMLSSINNKSLNQDIESIILEYMEKYTSIFNKCNAEPYYKLQFQRKNDTIGFWIAAYLGKPGLVKPQPPDEYVNPNPIEIKGVLYIKGNPLVIYDFKRSNGYDIYDTSKVSIEALQFLKDIPEECPNVWYPEAWFYIITKDSIYKSEVREAFQLK